MQLVLAAWPKRLAGKMLSPLYLHQRKELVMFSGGKRMGKKSTLKSPSISRSFCLDRTASLKEGDLFGEGCLAGQPLRMATAVALSECSLMKIEKAKVVSLLHEEPSLSKFFVAHLLSRNVKIDQLFNSSEKRLASSVS
jgi:CRP-like cAMP-binding protein